ncbi:MAG: Rhodanese protein [Campylobacterota bacterium]|nr:Rhodanese protein [Campylobacterota bacterium]
MIIKNLVLLMMFALVLSHARVGFEYEGISVNIPTSDAKTKTIIVKRNIPKECLKIPNHQ